MTMSHRRNVNNPFANRSRRTVGYSDQRYGSQQTHRGKKGFPLTRMTFLLAALGSIVFFNAFMPKTNLDDYTSTAEEKASEPKPVEKKTSAKVGRKKAPKADQKEALNTANLGGNEEHKEDEQSPDDGSLDNQHGLPKDLEGLGPDEDVFGRVPVNHDLFQKSESEDHKDFVDILNSDAVGGFAGFAGENQGDAPRDPDDDKPPTEKSKKLGNGANQESTINVTAAVDGEEKSLGGIEGEVKTKNQTNNEVQVVTPSSNRTSPVVFDVEMGSKNLTDANAVDIASTDALTNSLNFTETKDANATKSDVLSGMTKSEAVLLGKNESVAVPTQNVTTPIDSSNATSSISKTGGDVVNFVPDNITTNESAGDSKVASEEKSPNATFTETVAVNSTSAEISKTNETKKESLVVIEEKLEKSPNATFTEAAVSTINETKKESVVGSEEKLVNTTVSGLASVDKTVTEKSPNGTVVEIVSLNETATKKLFDTSVSANKTETKKSTDTAVVAETISVNKTIAGISVANEIKKDPIVDGAEKPKSLNNTTSTQIDTNAVSSSATNNTQAETATAKQTHSTTDAKEIVSGSSNNATSSSNATPKNPINATAVNVALNTNETNGRGSLRGSKL